MATAAAVAVLAAAGIRSRASRGLFTTRVYSRSPVYQWVGPEGSVDETTGKTVGGNKRQVLAGYNVTYRVVYDNGSESYYTNFESN